MWEFKNKFIALLLAVLILMVGSGICSAAEIIVHSGESIQAAVDSGGNGTVIILDPGTYNQNVTIAEEMSGITFMSSTGNPDDVIVQGGNWYGATFVLEYLARDIIFKGITLKGSGDNRCAINGDRASWCTVENCKIIDQDVGIGVDYLAVFTIINTKFINCKYAIGIGELGSVSGRDNTFIDCGELFSYDKEFISSIELTNSTEIHTQEEPEPFPEPVAPTPEPVPEPTPEPAVIPDEVPVDDTSSHSSGGSSHSSSGGGGGSPEPASNVQVKDTSKVFIPNEKLVTFNFTNHVTTVESISFISKKTMGKTSAIVEDLKGKSTLVSDLPEGIVYKSFNVWVGNAGYGSSDNIQNASVSFRVNKTWMHENAITSVSLYEYASKEKEWIELPVTQVNEDEEFLYFTAQAPGFSSFVIIGKSIQRVQEEDEKITAENRAVGDIQEGSETEEAESNPKGNTLLSIGIVTGALLVGAFILKSMKK